jgi:hypothetical protein
MAYPDGYEVVFMVKMWYVFSIQRGPVDRKKQMVIEMTI